MPRTIIETTSGEVLWGGFCLCCLEKYLINYWYREEDFCMSCRDMVAYLNNVEW